MQLNLSNKKMNLLELRCKGSKQGLQFIQVATLEDMLSLSLDITMFNHKIKMIEVPQAIKLLRHKFRKLISKIDYIIIYK